MSGPDEAPGDAPALGWLDVHGLAAAHEYLTGDAGGFARLTAALRSRGNEAAALAVRSIVTRSTCRELSALVPHLRGAGAWVIDFAAAAPAVADADRQRPRLALAVPYALAAAAAARRGGLPTYLRGVPPCLLGPHAAWRLDVASHHGTPRDHGQPCSRCAARPECTGVDAAYLARFTDTELRPLATAPAPSDAPASLLD